ncbi:MAG: hypothetical protein IT425_08915 [Pirellulales bacterium]|nr:hypothetical protein [Pirellulales bacterium]
MDAETFWFRLLARGLMGIAAIFPASCVLGAEAAAPQAPPGYRNIFLNEIEPTRYAEAVGDSGVFGECEVIHERYADGRVRVERQVTLNSEGSYVNHGVWRQFSKDAQIIAEGNYTFGQRTGIWTRWLDRTDAALLSESPFKLFKPPFMSQSHFVDGQMDGEWAITDANERKVMVVSLKAGRRDGLSTLWFPNGTVYRQLNYNAGSPSGDVLEADAKSGELKVVARYESGRELVVKTEFYPKNRQKKSESEYLSARLVEKAADDYGATTLAKYVPDGNNIRNGLARAWYPNGQLQREGYYLGDKKVGTLSYWHENGQIAARGAYRDDKRDGRWEWYHANGQKANVGTYRTGCLVGEWRSWDEHGKLTKSKFYGDSAPPALPAGHTEIAQRIEPAERL